MEAVANSCLTSLVTLHDEIMIMVNVGRWIDVSASCRAFDTIAHDILNSKLEMGGFDGWTVQWIKSWLAAARELWSMPLC